MKRIFILLAGIVWAAGAAEPDLDQILGPGHGLANDRTKEARKPNLDPKRIINQSSSFLKEREPEMTSEEFALYEKVMTMLGTNPAFAIRLLEAMVNEDEKPSPAFEFILGNAYYAAGEMGPCENHYRSAVERFPTFLRAWNNLGVLYYSTDRYAQAVRCFSQAVVLGDKDPATFGLLGYCLEKEGNLVSAEMAYMQALAGAPDSVEWKEGLLRIYTAGRQFGRAEPLVKSLIKENPREGRFWLAYGNILLADERRLEAIAVLEAAVGLAVGGLDEMALLGDLYAEQQLTPEAVAVYEKILVQAPQMGEGKLLHYAQVLIGEKKFDRAGELLGRMEPVTLTPEARLVWLQAKADLLVGREEWPAARVELERLLTLSPLNGRGLLSLGRTYAAEDNWPRALLAFEAAYRVPTATYRASLELANIELRNGHYDRTIQYLEKALSLQKTDGVQDYLARVKTLAAREP